MIFICQRSSSSRVQRHSELVYAEAQLLKAMLTLITDTNLVAFVREGFTMRASYTTLKACNKFVERIWDEEGNAGYKKFGVDEHFISVMYLMHLLLFFSNKFILLFSFDRVCCLAQECSIWFYQCCRPKFSRFSK